MSTNSVRAEARFVKLPTPHVIIKDVNNPDDVYMVGAAAANIERISSHLYISYMSSGLTGKGAEQTYTLEIRVDGAEADLHKVVAMSNAKRLFEVSNPLVAALQNAARSTLRVPVVDRSQLHLELETTDETLIVKSVAIAVLKCGGTFHRFHAETLNSGRYPGTADFVIDATIGFSTTAQSDLAAQSLLDLQRRYDRVKVRKLYEAGNDEEMLQIAA